MPFCHEVSNTRVIFFLLLLFLFLLWIAYPFIRGTGTDKDRQLDGDVCSTYLLNLLWVANR